MRVAEHAKKYGITFVPRLRKLSAIFVHDLSQVFVETKLEEPSTQLPAIASLANGRPIRLKHVLHSFAQRPPLGGAQPFSHPALDRLVAGLILVELDHELSGSAHAPPLSAKLRRVRLGAQDGLESTTTTSDVEEGETSAAPIIEIDAALRLPRSYAGTFKGVTFARGVPFFSSSVLSSSSAFAVFPACFCVVRNSTIGASMAFTSGSSSAIATSRW